MAKVRDRNREEAPEEEIHIVELLDVERVQRLLDTFADMTGMAALAADAEGVPITEGSNFTEFCMKYTRGTEIGLQRCEWCDRYGAEETWNTGKACAYYCHAGLIDYSAPIVARDKLVGCIMGGQVLTAPPDETRFRKIAREIGVDPDEYWDAVRKVNIVPKEQIDKCAAFLQALAETISTMAYSRYEIYRSKRQVERAAKEIERAANMKSDFLANMSHEIRTPMNAVIGMAEMALREDIPGSARNYLNQIKSSGHNLLAIINDILDFSKIESGKMDIIPVEYEAMSVVHDVSNMVMTRLDGKNVELLIDLDPKLPKYLEGDNIRISQVLLNLANNAAKFTEVGSVTLSLDFKKRQDGMINFEFAVQDTGIGIKKLDLDRLFKSFQQVDSKRNRNVEGTGLGLAISQKLLKLMDGKIFVESEYEQGSTFSFTVPQKVVDETPSIVIKSPEDIRVYSRLAKKILQDHLEKDVKRLGLSFHGFETIPELEGFISEENIAPWAEGALRHYVFFDEAHFGKEELDFVSGHPEITGVLVLEFYSSTKYDLPNLKLMRKPVYTMNLGVLFNDEDLNVVERSAEDVEFDYTAPEARALIVDDNAINVTVAIGLMEPLGMQIDSALSGKNAIEKISERKYDLIFMDHMMPEMDGVE
ncbi:MAG: PocR ligand-binding domain-containing protein, partial [Lachnospiraceae bacterium]|nr:PocR ligand-binding domain-containing protein [Lachnospiraceae bacterium]